MEKTPIIQPVPQKETAPPKKAVESMYSVEELSGQSKRFGQSVTPECVTAAMTMAGLDMATMENAKQIVKKFRERIVN